MNVNGYMKKTEEKLVVAYLKVPSRHSPELTDQIMKISARMTNALVRFEPDSSIIQMRHINLVTYLITYLLPIHTYILTYLLLESEVL